MPTKTISTYAAGGYTLGAAYDTLTITATGGVGGTGVSAANLATVANAGTINATVGRGSEFNYFGVFLANGGKVTNTGEIVGNESTDSAAGVQIQGGAGDVDNSSLIQGGYGVVLLAGGSVTNRVGGVIQGYTGVEIDGAGKVTNAGTINATYGPGVLLKQGGNVTNSGKIASSGGGFVSPSVGVQTSGIVTNQLGGVIEGANGVTGGTVINSGYIHGTGVPFGYSSYAGVNLNGGSVTNNATGVIRGAGDGLYGNNYAVTVTNAGSIIGSSSGIDLRSGGGVTNNAKGVIQGANDGLAASSYAVTVTNAGSIIGGSSGIDLQAGGSVTNNAKGVIQGGKFGLYDYSYAATVTNQADGLIVGGVRGGYFRQYYASGTVTNFGTIASSAGGSGTSLDFTSAADRLIAEAGSTFTGKVVGGGGTLELANGTGTITGLGGAASLSGAETMSFSGFGNVVLDAGASRTLAGSNSLGAGQSLSSAGSLTVTGSLAGAGTLAITAGTDSFGAGSTLTIAKVSQSGGERLRSPPTSPTARHLELQGAGTLAVGAGHTLTLSGAGDAFAGRLIGAGTLAISSGTTAFNPGAQLTISKVAQSGGVVNVTTSLTDAGAWTQIAGTLAVAAGCTLTLSGVGDSFAGTVTNFGTIAGGTSFTSAAGRLIAEAGSTFTGKVIGGGGTLELANGTGTITGLGGAASLSGAETMSFSGFGHVVLDAGASRTLAGSNSLGAGRSLASAGSLTLAGTLSGAGTLAITGGTTNFNAGAQVTIAKVAQSGGGAYVTTDLGYAGVWTQSAGTLGVGPGHTLTLSGAGDTFAGRLIGAGTLAITGGTTSFGAGSTLAVAKVAQSGGGAYVTTNLAYAGVWTQSAGTLGVGPGDTLTLSGAGDTFAGRLIGAGTVALAGGTDRLTGTTIAAATHVTIKGAKVTLAGIIANSGSITAATSRLVVAWAGATLSGAGHLTLTNATTNKIAGAGTTATLTNVDNLISGGGQLGGGQMRLVNQAAGRITGNVGAALIIDTGTSAIQNAGTITANAGGGVEIKSAIANSGLLVAAGGTLSLDAAVTGAGSVKIGGGTLDALASFNQNVAFTGTTGKLELAHSLAYTGQISGFSHTGTTSLDLRDIGFASAAEATFAGTTAGGTLTVSDGTHTAKIKLIGDYTHASFTASSDGHGGTAIVDPSAPSVHHFVAAVAAMGAPADGSTPPAHWTTPTAAMLLAHAGG